MIDLDPSYRQQIEVLLGRPLSEEELRPAAGLTELSPAQLTVVRHLMGRQLVLTTLYVRSIASVSVGDVTRFLDRLDSEEKEAALLAKHPELAAVGEALRQIRAGEPVTATCATCGNVLVADALETTGALVIRCPDGHTSFRRVAAPTLVRGASK